MEMTYFTLILCAALLVGLGLPGLIYFSSRKKKGINEYDVLNRMMRKYRQAWTADQDEMQELSRQVEILQVKRTQNSESIIEGRAGRDVSPTDETSDRS
jgi:hypothetical protein